MRNSIKILPLDSWQRPGTYKPQGIVRIEEFWSCVGHSLHPRTEPIFFRQGRYFDRHAKRCWFETYIQDQWIAFKEDYQCFLYSLKEAEEEEHPISALEAAAIEIVIRAQACPPKARKILEHYLTIRKKSEWNRRQRAKDLANFLPFAKKLKMKRYKKLYERLQ